MAAVTLDTVSKTMTDKFQTAQNEFDNVIKGLNMSNPADLSKMQMAMTKWNLSISAMSTSVQQTGESLKGIVRDMK